MAENDWQSKPFDEWTIKDADAALAARKDERADKAQLFYDGDHWQGSAGWIGQKPPDDAPDKQELLAAIQAGFIFENAIKGVTDRHVGGVLGDEPTFALTPRPAPTPVGRRKRSGQPAAPAPTPDAGQPDPALAALIAEAEAALTGEWWDRRRPVETLRKALRLALLRRRGTLRLYVPVGLRNEDGTIQATPVGGQDALAAALAMIYVDTLEPAQAGVITQDDTKREVGVFRYERAGKQYAELTYLDEAGLTVLRVVGDGVAEQRATFPLGGRLLMYEIEREPLITDGVMQLQKLVNLARTMMGRTINMAGFRERTILNAAKPGRWVDGDGNEVAADVPGARFEEGAWQAGAGVTNIVVGLPLYDAENNLTGYTNPNINYGDPASPEAFIKTRDDAIGAILDEVNQRHVLISGDAAASGYSREQARAEYEQDLGVSKLPVDGAGRWQIETVLRLGAVIAGTPDRFDALRGEFSARIDGGPISADEQRVISERHEKGLLSKEGAMEAQGVLDVAAELARIAAEEDEALARQDASINRLATAARPQTPQDDPNNPATGDNAA